MSGHPVHFVFGLREEMQNLPKMTKTSAASIPEDILALCFVEVDAAVMVAAATA